MLYRIKDHREKPGETYFKNHSQKPLDMCMCAH